MNTKALAEENDLSDAYVYSHRSSYSYLGSVKIYKGYKLRTVGTRMVHIEDMQGHIKSYEVDEVAAKRWVDRFLDLVTDHTGAITGPEVD